MSTEDEFIPVSPNQSLDILVCDDSPDQRSVLSRYLSGKDYEVHEAGSADEALEYLKTHELDLVLLDLHMPGRNGFDVLRYMQEHRRSLPVILLSGMSLDDIQHEIHTLPRRELPPLLLKPIDLDQLHQVIELEFSGEMPVAPAPSDVDDINV